MVSTILANWFCPEQSACKRRSFLDAMRYGNLSGITNVVIRDPRDMAREALPQALAALTDIDEPAEPLSAADFAVEQRAPCNDC